MAITHDERHAICDKCKQVARYSRMHEIGLQSVCDFCWTTHLIGLGMSEEFLGNIKWGFDSTSFGYRDQWILFLERNGIDPDGLMTRKGWVFEGDGILIATAYHPATGQHHHRLAEYNDKGFAGYIGVEGRLTKL